MPVAQQLQGLINVAPLPPSWRTRVDRLTADWNRVRRQYPRAVVAVLSIVTATMLFAVLGVLWYAADLRRGLPDDQLVLQIANMEQSTAVFDANDRLTNEATRVFLKEFLDGFGQWIERNATS